MGESYSEPDGAAAAAGALLAQLLPGVDVALLMAALRAERLAGAPGDLEQIRTETELEPPALELQRVRAQFARGEAARTVQHTINNPLAALLAEAQLLELDALGEDQRKAVGRIVALARRLVAISRQLDVSGTPVPPAGNGAHGGTSGRTGG